MGIINTTTPGMMELSVGYAATQKAYDAAMTPAKLKGCSVVVASLTTNQTDGIELLLKNNFIQVGSAKRNPNSGHMILLFIKYFS